MFAPQEIYRANDQASETSTSTMYIISGINIEIFLQLASRPRYNLVVDEDVKKPTK